MCIFHTLKVTTFPKNFFLSLVFRWLLGGSNGVEQWTGTLIERYCQECKHFVDIWKSVHFYITEGVIR